MNGKILFQNLDIANIKVIEFLCMFNLLVFTTATVTEVVKLVAGTYCQEDKLGQLITLYQPTRLDFPLLY